VDNFTFFDLKVRTMTWLEDFRHYRVSVRSDSLAEREGFEPSYMDPAPVASRSID